MKKARIRLDVIAYTALLLASWMAAIYLTPHELSPLASAGFDLEAVIPEEFEGWTLDSEVSPLQPIETGSLADRIYDQTVSRGYRNPAGDLIMLVVAYGQNQSDALQIHRPEICYSANGFHVSDPRRYYLNLDLHEDVILPLLKLETNNYGHYEPITYWTRVGDALPSGNWTRQYSKITYGLRGKIPDGILVRVSSISRDSENAFKVHDEFINRLLNAIPAEYQQLFLGKLSPSFPDVE